METEIYTDSKKDIIAQEKIKELEELIDLSEKVSDKVSYLTKRRNFTFLLIVSSAILAVSTFILFFIYINEQIMMKREPLFMLFGTIISIFSLILAYGVIERRKINHEIENEKKILDRLFEMISNLKESTDIGIISRVIYEMRLSRIQFS
jgi:hypothetical protein